MKYVYEDIDTWKRAIQQMLTNNWDIATGTIEKPFIIIYSKGK